MNILVADDHALIREGLRMVLRDFDQGMVCFDAFDGASVERTLAQHPEIELLLLDRRLPDCDGMDLLVRLVEAHPALPIVMLSAEFDADTVTQAIDRGAAGFIPKTSVTNVLVSALKLIMAGGIYVPPEVLRRDRAPRATLAAQGAAMPPIAVLAGGVEPIGRAPVAGAAQAAPPSAADLGLTDRQTDVLALLMEGKSNKQISRELDLAEATVKVHVRSILRALDASSRTEAVVAASRLGLAPLARRQPDSGPQ
ncbi:MAG: response regulator transcription factor [Burkholderiaceae bacterium]|nr:response regulator transcription factor [Burkholderiaceae bacterium]